MYRQAWVSCLRIFVSCVNLFQKVFTIEKTLNHQAEILAQPVHLGQYFSSATLALACWVHESSGYRSRDEDEYMDSPFPVPLYFWPLEIKPENASPVWHYSLRRPAYHLVARWLLLDHCDHMFVLHLPHENNRLYFSFSFQISYECLSLKESNRESVQEGKVGTVVPTFSSIM